MDEIKHFLELSTIHGLYHISAARDYANYFWVFTVLGGFSGAGYLIHTSFYNWEQSPISTTIETLPISQITFPNVTVCPPKQSFLTLNYDIHKSETLIVDEEIRKELFTYAMNLIQDNIQSEIMKNLSKVQNTERYYNWYHGYTRMDYPFYNQAYDTFSYSESTTATSGNISTQHFGDKFDADKMDGNINIRIEVWMPDSAKYDNSTTIMFDIQKINIKDYRMSAGVFEDYMQFYYLPVDSDQYFENITVKPDSDYNKISITLERIVPKDVMGNLSINDMPGFHIKWKYDRKLANQAKYGDEGLTKEFVRCYVLSFHFSLLLYSIYIDW